MSDPAIWRCGVMATVEAVDVLLRDMRKSRRYGVREAADELDKLLQRVVNARHEFAPATYGEAATARDEIVARETALRSTPSAS